MRCKQINTCVYYVITKMDRLAGRGARITSLFAMQIIPNNIKNKILQT